MKERIKITTQNIQIEKATIKEGIRIVLFMSFIPGIYFLGKLISELF